MPGRFVPPHATPRSRVGLRRSSRFGQRGAHFLADRLDGLTGAVEQGLVAPGWNGRDYAPCGGALDKQQRAWFTGLRGELARVETGMNPITITRIGVVAVTVAERGPASIRASSPT